MELFEHVCDRSDVFMNEKILRKSGYAISRAYLRCKLSTF